MPANRRACWPWTGPVAGPTSGCGIRRRFRGRVLAVPPRSAAAGGGNRKDAPGPVGLLWPGRTQSGAEKDRGQAGATTIAELCQAYYRAVNAADPYHPSCLFFYGHGKVPVPDWPDTYDMTGQSYFYIGTSPRSSA